MKQPQSIIIIQNKTLLIFIYYYIGTLTNTALVRQFQVVKKSRACQQRWRRPVPVLLAPQYQNKNKMTGYFFVKEQQII